MNAIEELGCLLRPAGAGLHLVSTGLSAQQALQRRLYRVQTDDEVQACWKNSLAQVKDAKVVLLGVPSDVGAGFRRGANLGPRALREGLLAQVPDWPERAQRLGVVDLGDVFVVPQLLHDEMLSSAQLERTRRSIYSQVENQERNALPVSPLSILERVLSLLWSLNPSVVPLVLGGDHSVAWPVASVLSRVRSDRWGILQIDAHTDLLEERLGIPYCFATWSFHANRLLGGDGRMVQVGLRASRFGQEHWEGTTGVRQVWAKAFRANARVAIERTLELLHAAKVTGIYLSNDVDGTDARWMDRTGTPEPNGLEPEEVLALLRAVTKEFPLLAADVVELAPALAPGENALGTSVPVAVNYLRETLSAMVNEAV